MEEYIYILLIIISLLIIGVITFKYYSKRKYSTMEEKKVDKKAIELRLQAYERFVLFLERCRPQSILVRMSSVADSVESLQVILISAIREEFEHNFSQQIYLSEASWGAVCATKDNFVRMINIAAKDAEGDTISVFSEKLLSLVYEKENDLTDTTLKLLRNEARLLYL